LGAASALRETQRSTPSLNWSVLLPGDRQADYAQELAATRATLDELAFEVTWAARRQLSVEAACADALTAVSAWQYSVAPAGARPD
jgi:hypothetical protein